MFFDKLGVWRVEVKIAEIEQRMLRGRSHVVARGNAKIFVSAHNEHQCGVFNLHG